MTTVDRTTVRIPTPSGFDIEAWFYLPEGQGPFPAVVMGHGLGAVKVGGLASFAERFCREGFAAVVIDYRQWGGSDGQQPRDELNVPRQLEDYSAAIGCAAAQPDIDEHRIFVWGTSFAGMHATALAASDHRLAGAIAQCPLVDGLAGSRLVRPTRPLRYLPPRSSTVSDHSLAARRSICPSTWLPENGASPTHQMHYSARKSCTRASRSTGTTGWRRDHYSASPPTAPSATPATSTSRSCSSSPNTTPRHPSVPHSPWPITHPTQNSTAAKADTTTSTTAESPSTTSSSGKSTSSAAMPSSSRPGHQHNRREGNTQPLTLNDRN